MALETGAEGTRSRAEVRLTDGPLKISRLLWGIDWAKLLPRAITSDGIELHLSSVEQALPFIGAHYAEIFEQDPASERFFTEPFDGPKLRYLESSDVFEMKAAERTVGLLICAPSDWSTYYIRTMAVLPAFSGRHLPRTVFPFIFGQLAQVGVRRFEAEASPSNFATIQVLSRQRFNPTGMILSERWGALVRLTKFADEKAENVFLDKFCSGVRYQKRPSKGESPNGREAG